MQVGEAVADYLERKRGRRTGEYGLLADIEDNFLRARAASDGTPLPRTTVRTYVREFVHGLAQDGTDGLSHGVVALRGARPRAVAAARKWTQLRDAAPSAASRNPSPDARVRIEYGAVENKREGRGWLPRIWVNGRGTGHTFWPTGHSRDEAIARARVEADEEAARHGGDFSVSVEPRP